MFLKPENSDKENGIQKNSKLSHEKNAYTYIQRKLETGKVFYFPLFCGLISDRGSDFSAKNASFSFTCSLREPLKKKSILNWTFR